MALCILLYIVLNGIYDNCTILVNSITFANIRKKRNIKAIIIYTFIYLILNFESENMKKISNISTEHWRI
jgi:hypothetical protein